MFKLRNRLTSVAAIAIVALAASASLAQEYVVEWWTMDAGGIMDCTGGPFELSGTIGQHDAGPSVLTGGNFEITGGFWTVSSHAAGDCDYDGDVDLDDFDLFAGCMAGPDSAVSSSCGCFDFDSDSDVDLSDFASFQMSNLN